MMNNETINLPARNPRIDVLRGIAIFIVLLLHFNLTYSLPGISTIVSSGNYGVTMFFVISGFLITKNILARYGSLKNIHFFHFYIFRIARIFPGIILALAFILFFAYLEFPSFSNESSDSLPSHAMFLSIFSILTFWHNWLIEYWGYFNYSLNIYWSLSVEEVFYLAFPVACFILRATYLLSALLLFLMALGPFYRFHHQDNELLYLYSYSACFDAIAIGVLSALVKRSFSKNFSQIMAIIASFLLGCVYLNGIEGHAVWGFSLIALSTSILLLTAKTALLAYSSFLKCLIYPVQWLGHHSYELYLFHIIVLALMRDLIPAANVNFLQTTLLALLFLIASVFFSYLIARFYTEPLNQKIRLYFTQSRRLK